MVGLMSGPQVSFGILVFFGKNKLIHIIRKQMCS